MVKVIKNKVLWILAFASGLIFSTIVPAVAQNLPLLPEDAAVKCAVMHDGLKCYVADNPYVKGFADYALVSRESGKTLLRLRDIPAIDAFDTDSALIKIMYQVESIGTPSGLAVIACGDLRADETLSKMRYMSYMIPASAEVPVLEISNGEQTPVSFSISNDASKGLSTASAQWTAPRTPKELLATTQPAVYDKAVHELGTVICSRVRKTLRDKGIPVADVSFRHVGSQQTMSAETFAFNVTVRDSSAIEAESALKAALASVDAYGASASELLLAERLYFRDLESQAYGPDRTNEAYIQMCIRACLMDTPLASSAQRLAYLSSKDVSAGDREQIFAGITSALMDLPATESVADSKVCFNASDTMAFPSGGAKVGMRLARKEHLSGGSVWTFSNGFKVVYKKMPTSGVLYYTLALNGGYGDIKDLAKGEGAYVSDYLKLCNVAGMKARDFAKVLQLSGITMDAQVNLSNVMISGRSDDSNAALLMKALLAVANERTPDHEAIAYHVECEKLRLLHAPADPMSAVDSLMCPGYRYASYKYAGNLPVDLASKAEGLLERISSKMNDGVLVLVGDMYESDLKKALLPYVGGFRTNEGAPRKTVVNYQPVSGSMTYNVDGEQDEIVLSISTRMPMTVDNYATSEVAAMVLKRFVVDALEPYGVSVQFDYTMKIYPEDRLNVTFRVSAPDGGHMPHEVLAVLRRTVSGASERDMNTFYVKACKEYLKHMRAINMKEPGYWLDAVAMRYLDGKDYTSGYASRIDSVSMEDIRKLLGLLEAGNGVEYIINRK